jgi:hypothetical protein
MAENKKMILVIGSTGTGKTTSLRNLDKSKSVYIDFDRKAIKAFRDMDDFREWIKIDYIDHLLPGLKGLESDPDCEYIIIDTLSFALDMFVAQKIDTAADTRAAWGDYKRFYKELIHLAKSSTKSYIFLTHEKSSYNEEAMETKTTAYAQGSISGMIEADFALVAYTHKYVDKDGMPAYGMLVGPTKETLALSAKSPMGMFDKPLIEDNDVMLLIEAAESY